ncbi:MAG: phytoene desaturase family protein [Gemmatimonadales bacterium]
MTSAPWDAVVIGAGVNGLAVAATLGRAGLRVLVLERRPVLGGVAATEELAPGFRVDACLHDLGVPAPALVEDLGLARHGLELIRPDPAVVALPPSGGSAPPLALWADPARSVEAIRRHSPGDAERWPEFAARMGRLAGFLESLYAAPAPNITSSRPADVVRLLGLGHRARRLGKTGLIDLLRTLPMSVAELLDDWFESEALKGALGAAGIRGILQGPRSGGTAFVFLHHAVGSPPGAPRSRCVVRGGLGRFAQALAAAAREHGVDIRTGVDVARVRVRDGRAVGVVTGAGDEIATRAVVSGADPRRTLMTLVDPTELEPEFARAVLHLKYRGAVAKVNLALDALPTFPALASNGATELLRGAIAPGVSLEALEHAYDDAKHGGVSRRPFLEVRIPSVADPSHAPPGKHVMSVWVQYAPYRLKRGTWDEGRRSKLGDLVVDTLADHAPGLKALIVQRQVLTPKDLEDVYGVTEGSLYHGELTLDQILFMRPVPGWSRYRTPIHQLYLCGAGTHPGGGLGMAGGSGLLAAGAVLRDARLWRTA